MNTQPHAIVETKPVREGVIQRLRQWRPGRALPTSGVVKSHQPLPVGRRDQRSASGYVMLVESDISPAIPWIFR